MAYIHSVTVHQYVISITDSGFDSLLYITHCRDDVNQNFGNRMRAIGQSAHLTCGKW